jgi:hypothetical protein
MSFGSISYLLVPALCSVVAGYGLPIAYREMMNGTHAPNRLEEYVDRIQHDIVADSASLEIETRGVFNRDEWLIELLEVADGVLWSFPVTDELEEIDLVLACGQLQDVIIEISRRAWPRCPLHGHPLVADLEQEPSAMGVWRCPNARSNTWRIGELPRNEANDSR